MFDNFSSQTTPHCPTRTHGPPTRCTSMYIYRVHARTTCDPAVRLTLLLLGTDNVHEIAPAPDH